MNSDSKGFAIAATAVFLGAIGAMITPWALPCAAIAIAAIALAPNTDGQSHD